MMPPTVHAVCARGTQLLFVCLAAGLLAFAPVIQADPSNGDDDSNASPRQLYNDGTRKLREGKLREAETSFQSAVASQDERVQPVALYNLGHVRFREGEQELTNAPNSKALEMTTRRVYEMGGTAIKSAEEALAGDDPQKIVSAYLQGRGARRELKAAMEAVKNAMKQYGSVLVKWQRASGDFKSAFELLPSDDEAHRNGVAMDRKIAALIDQQQKMLEAMQAMNSQKQAMKLKELLERIRKDAKDRQNGSEGGMKSPGQGPEGSKPGAGSGEGMEPGMGRGKQPGGGGGMDLQQLMQDSLSGMQGERAGIGELMKELRKRLPKEIQDAMQGQNGDDDDEEEDQQNGDNGDKGDKPPKEPKPGEFEASGHEGNAEVLTMDEALRYLGMLRLDNDRKLPLGVSNTENDHKERRGRDW